MVLPRYPHRSEGTTALHAAARLKDGTTACVLLSTPGREIGFQIHLGYQTRLKNKITQLGGSWTATNFFFFFPGTQLFPLFCRPTGPFYL